MERNIQIAFNDANKDNNFRMWTMILGDGKFDYC